MKNPMGRFGGLVVLALALFCAVPVSAGITSPLIGKQVTASIEGDRFEAVVGEVAFLFVRLDPESPPMGYYVSTLVDVIEGPERAKPEVVPGFPKIKLTFAEPGAYVLEIRVNLITKPSCGGVEAEEILREEVEFRVSGMDS